MTVKKLYWTFQIAGWGLYAFLNIFFIIIGSVPLSFKTVLGYIVLGGFFIFSTHQYRRMIRKLGWLQLEISRLIPRALLATLALSVAFVSFEWLLVAALNQPALQPDALITLLMNVVTAMILYIAWSMIYFLYHYIDSYNKSLKYEAAMNEIELNRLKSQLNPHFMFNALNSIRRLVDENPSQSKKAITQLSNILRNALITDKSKLIRFNDELATVNDYLALETIRYEERLKVEMNIHADSNQFMAPPLMIQTLVENGIKHGISKLKEGGWIKIDTFVLDGSLVVQIRNSGRLDESALDVSHGYGVSNTIRRLKLIYGQSATFKIMNENGNTVLTEITIPKISDYESAYNR